MANILIVDDDKRITDFLCDQLKIRGHSCRYENRGDQLLEKVNMRDVDLLILDVMLPDVSGFEVCRRVRANTEYYTLPILFLSSMDSQEEINHGLAQGADDFVTKPFVPNILLTRIENLINSSAKTSLTDEVTGLPNSKSIKAEIQKAISRKTVFSIGYLELMGINDFHLETDRNQQLKALRHFARCIHLCARQIEPRFFSIGHMGGGHFVYIIDPEKSDALVQRVNDVWSKHLVDFLDAVGKPNQIKTWKVNRTLEFLLCVTKREADSTHSSRDLFETLSHLRSTAEVNCHSGVFRDRRH
jgi:DNA-binding response OmpR family regulator